MLVHCPKCHMMYDDTTNTTICPHAPLGGGSGGYCKRHDLFGPCPLCRPVPPEDRHPVTRVVVRDDFMAGESAPVLEDFINPMVVEGVVREDELPSRRVEEQTDEQRREAFDWWTQAASKRFRNVWPAGVKGPTVECCNCGAHLSHSEMTTHECEGGKECSPRDETDRPSDNKNQGIADEN